MSSNQKNTVKDSFGLGFWAPILVSTLMLLPMLWQGLFTDDWLFLKSMRAPAEGQPPLWDMYRLIPQDIDILRQHRLMGDLPWWTDTELRIAFLRPIPSLLMPFDNAVWGDNWFGYHSHSFLWRTFFLFSGVLAIRAMTTDRTIAVWASWIFCLENAHLVTAGWWSNRHALIAGSFALLGLWAHLRHKSVTSTVFVALALLSGELALAIFGFFIALLFFPRTSRREELRASRPQFFLLGAYAMLYVLLSRGVTGSAFYLDPLHATWDYIVAFPQRWLILFGEMFHQLPSDLAFVGQGNWLIGLGFAVFIWVWKSPRGRADWALLGAGLSLFPAIGAPPSGRMLLLATLGSAFWLSHRLNSLQNGQSRWAKLALGWTLCIPPLLGLGMLHGQNQAAHSSEIAAQAAYNHCPMDREVWILNPPDHIIGVYLSLVQDQSLRLPRQHIRALSLGPRTIEHRLVDNELQLRTDQPFLHGDLERFWNRNPDTNFHGPKSLRIRVSGDHLTATYDGLGTASGPCLLQWADSRLVPAQPGQTWQRIERSSSPSGL